MKTSPVVFIYNHPKSGGLAGGMCVLGVVLAVALVAVAVVMARGGRTVIPEKSVVILRYIYMFNPHLIYIHSRCEFYV